jgi:hypothetical protein
MAVAGMSAALFMPAVGATPDTFRTSATSDIPVPGDWNGDRVTDFGVFNRTNALWTTPFAQQFFGSPSDVPVSGDWNGDGRTDFGVFNRTNGLWTTPFGQTFFGSRDDIPVPGDWNGDGRTDFGVFNPTNALWTTPFSQQTFGSVGDIPVPGDWNGDGRTDFGVFNPTNALWTTPFTQQFFGSRNDIPVAGDWNGDRRTDFGVYNPTNSLWTTPFTQQTFPPVAAPPTTTTSSSTTTTIPATTSTTLPGSTTTTAPAGSGSAPPVTSSPPPTAPVDQARGVFASGSVLDEGKMIGSPGSINTLVMQTDGNFVLYRNGAGALWASGTSRPGTLAVMQGDGNLVLYIRGTTTAVWASGTGGNPGAYLVVQDDGNLVIQSAVGKPLWDRFSGRGVQARISPGSVLDEAEVRGSANGAYSLVMQDDGNLVLYRNGGGALWATGTSGAGLISVMQQDGNFVIYQRGTAQAYWASNTGGNPGASMAIQDDGNLVIYSASGRALWDRFPKPAYAPTVAPKGSGSSGFSIGSIPRPVNDPCLGQYPGGGTSRTSNSFLGSITRYDRTASQYLTCEGFGSHQALTLTPGMKCALIEAVTSYIHETVAAAAESFCTSLGLVETIKDRSWLGSAGGEACGYLSDVAGPAFVLVVLHGVGGKPAIAALTTALHVSCAGIFDNGGHDFGTWLEATAETNAARGINVDGKCLEERRIVGTSSWWAVNC